MTQSDVGERAEMMELLRKISKDNEKLHQEVAFLREENAKAILKLEKSIPAQIAAHLGHVKQDIHNSISSHIEDFRNDIQGTFELRLPISIQSTLLSMTERKDEFDKILHKDIAAIHRAVNTLRASQDNLHHHDEFTLFPKLPVELRLRIWNIACFNNPSIVKVRVSRLPDFDPANFLASGYHLPSVLQTSHESRQEALKWYQRWSFRNGLNDDIYQYEGEGFKYFNFDIDILYLITDSKWNSNFSGHCWVEVATKSKELCHFHRIAVSYGHTRAYLAYEWKFIARSLLDPRSKIEELIFVLNEYLPREWTDQKLIPVSGDCSLRYFNDDGDEFATDVATELKTRLEYLDSSKWEDSTEDEESESDESSDDETPSEPNAESTVMALNNLGPTEADGRASEANEVVSDEVDSRPQTKYIKKPWPKLTYMALEDVHSVSNARIYSA